MFIIDAITRLHSPTLNRLIINNVASLIILAYKVACIAHFALFIACNTTVRGACI